MTILEKYFFRHNLKKGSSSQKLFSPPLISPHTHMYAASVVLTKIIFFFLQTSLTTTMQILFAEWRPCSTSPPSCYKTHPYNLHYLAENEKEHFPVSSSKALSIYRVKYFHNIEEYVGDRFIFFKQKHEDHVWSRNYYELKRKFREYSHISQPNFGLCYFKYIWHYLLHWPFKRTRIIFY